MSNVTPELAERYKKRAQELAFHGFDQDYIDKQLAIEFAFGSHWQPPVFNTDWGEGHHFGNDVLPAYTDAVPDTGYPPVLPQPAPNFNNEPYLTNADRPNVESVAISGDLSAINTHPGLYKKEEDPELKEVENITYPKDSNANYVATGSKQDSQPAMVNEHPSFGQRQTPEESYYPPTLKEIEPILMQYVYQGHDQDDICAGFQNKIFDLNNRTNRPIPPSEGLGYTNTHPNCQCYWGIVGARFEEDTPTDEEKSHLQHVNRIVGQRSRRHTLHTVKPDGSLSQRTRGTNPIHESIRETVLGIREQFDWLTPDYVDRIKQVQTPGTWLLIRAAEEAITNHTADPLVMEEYPRHLTNTELHATARTAIGKGADLNHLGEEFLTGGKVMDAEHNLGNGQTQFLVFEQDPEVIQGIANGIISAVSINAGAPRHMDTVCDDKGCLLEPKGLVLGELDGIAFTYVVTDPRGFLWKGNMIPPAKPGVATTGIEIL